MKRAGVSILSVVVLSGLLTLGSIHPLSAQTKPIELTFNHLVPPVIPFAKVAQNWAKMIEEKSGGRVKITFYWSASLMPQQEIFKAVQTGVADVSYYPLNADFQPLSFFASLPLMGFTSSTQGTEIYHKIYEQFPAVRDEFKGTTVLSTRMGAMSQIHTTKRAVQVPGDMKGLKLSGVGKQTAKFIQAGGAAPITGGAAADMYMNLERGLSDGTINHFPLILVFGTLPLLQNHAVFGEGGVSGSIEAVIMNMNKFKSLPPDVQKIVEEASDWYTAEAIKLDISEVKRAEAAAKGMNHNFVSIDSPEKLKPWEDVAQPLHEDWIKEMEQKGKPGRAVYDAVKKLLSNR